MVGSNAAVGGLHSVVFTWRGPARVVYLSGEFDSWLQHQAERMGNSDVFVCRRELREGEFRYKWLIDNKWTVEPQGVQGVDVDGNLCNLVTVGPTRKSSDQEDSSGHVVKFRDPQWGDKTVRPVPRAQEPPPVVISSPLGDSTNTQTGSDNPDRNSSALSKQKSYGDRLGPAQASLPERSVRTGKADHQKAYPKNSASVNRRSEESGDRRSTRFSQMASKIINRLSLKRNTARNSNRESSVGRENISLPVAEEFGMDTMEDADHKAREYVKAAKMLHKWGDFAGAALCFEKAVECREKFTIHSFEHTEVLLDYAHVLSKQSKLKEAEVQLQKALKIWEKAPFPRKERKGDILLYYGVVLDRQKDETLRSLAEEQYRAALKIYEEAGIKSDNVEIARKNLQLNLRKRGKPLAAVH
uniref:AMP-activated protein kinase glycogen-binding domain-containing protein n=1 Tax=Compsopogon caeruleus TaxID=31354 RepID=A0A7S1T700_9RHOD|mmetsp:Transcript_11869/g.24185  ORF Transcript_11869/g.24185 Transcript_11869/m.24185 type:complete len:414 (+) Transcript_11869:80-1321(+)